MEEPRKIVSAAHQKVKSLEQVMPKLEALWGLARERPRVRFFEGKAGIKQVIESRELARIQQAALEYIWALSSNHRSLHLAQDILQG